MLKKEWRNVNEWRACGTQSRRKLAEFVHGIFLLGVTSDEWGTGWSVWAVAPP
jgi:hypothetical protein